MLENATNITCLICCSDKRPVRFVSKRMQICQWCVSFLCKNPVDPIIVTKDIYEKAKFSAVAEIEHEIRQKIPSYQQVKNEVSARYAGTLIEDTFKNKLFKASEIRLQDQRLNSEINEMLRSAENAAVPPDKEDRIRAVFKSIISEVVTRKYIPIITKTKVHVKGNNYFGLRIRRSISHKPVDVSTLKYFAAIHYSITTGNSRIERMSDNEWYDLRVTIRKEDDNKCNICGAKYSNTMLHVHHIIPLSKFGSNHVNNLITLCEACHQKAHPDLQLNLPGNSTFVGKDAPHTLNQEAARQEAARQEAARQEATRQEAARQEAARQEAVRQKAVRQKAARAEKIEQERIANIEEKTRLAGQAENYHRFNKEQQRSNKGILVILGFIGFVLFILIASNNNKPQPKTKYQSLPAANYPTTTTNSSATSQIKQNVQNNSIVTAPKATNSRKSIAHTKVITRKYRSKTTTYKSNQIHKSTSNAIKSSNNVASDSIKIQQPIKRTDLTPNQKATMEMACFEAKVKGQLFFDDCMDRKLAALNTRK